MISNAILLVEDEPDDIELTRLALEKSRVANKIFVAQDGVEALEMLHGPNATELPALVLLDLKLPRIDGIEVLRRIRAHERTRFLPVVVLTSSREERDLIETYALGVNSYVVKPVDFDQFVEAARHIGMYWLLLNNRPPLGTGRTE
jgi:two-component system response regulator